MLGFCFMFFFLVLFRKAWADVFVCPSVHFYICIVMNSFKGLIYLCKMFIEGRNREGVACFADRLTQSDMVWKVGRISEVPGLGEVVDS